MIVLFSGTLLQYMYVAVACSSVATRDCVRAGMADSAAIADSAAVADSAAIADSAAVADTADPFSPSPPIGNHADSVNQGLRSFSTAFLNKGALGVELRGSRPRWPSWSRLAGSVHG